MFALEIRDADVHQHVTVDAALLRVSLPADFTLIVPNVQMCESVCIQITPLGEPLPTLYTLMVPVPCVYV